jgi:hypothetical protein
MTLDPDLLEKARTAGERLTAAERDAQIAKADYHHAIRRLHLAGAPLRQVALALGLSHQRVQQIVQAAGGSWWSRMWRGRTIQPDMMCSFCGLPPSVVSKLIAGPATYICDACLSLADDALAGVPRPQKGTTTMMTATVGRQVCSFCRKRPPKGQALASAGEGRVCGACVALCRRILDDRAVS